MACKYCFSENQQKFSKEMNFHFPCREGWEKPTVWVFPDVIVCLECGSAEFSIPEAELRKLTKGLAA